jgi:hypothetical protein
MFIKYCPQTFGKGQETIASSINSAETITCPCPNKTKPKPLYPYLSLYAKINQSVYMYI